MTYDTEGSFWVDLSNIITNMREDVNLAWRIIDAAILHDMDRLEDETSRIFFNPPHGRVGEIKSDKEVVQNIRLLLSGLEGYVEMAQELVAKELDG